MAIENAEVTRFCNEVVRPLAEEMRALDYRIQSALTVWYASIAGQCAVDGGTVEDGRDAEGVSRLSGNDVHLLIAQLAEYKAQMDGAGVRNVISKPCVRAF